MKNAPKPYFLLSFIPAIAYWLLETYFTLEIALIGGMVLGVIEMILEKKFTRYVHTLSKLNLSLIVVLGGISLLAKEGIFFKLQPTLTGLCLAGFFIYKRIKNQSIMVEMLKDLRQKQLFPEQTYKMIEWHMCLFLVVFASFMAFVALRESTATWLFWKTGGFYVAFGGFMIFEMIFLKLHLRKLNR